MYKVILGWLNNLHMPAFLWTIPESFLLIQASPVEEMIKSSAHPVFDHRLQITSILIIFGTVLLPTPFSIGNINKENLPCKDVIALVSSMGVLWISVVGANLHRHQTITIIRSWLIVFLKNGDQHEPKKKAISPVRSIQHVSNKHTGYISASLMQEYFQYKGKGEERTVFCHCVGFD